MATCTLRIKALFANTNIVLVEAKSSSMLGWNRFFTVGTKLPYNVNDVFYCLLKKFMEKFWSHLYIDIFFLQQYASFADKAFPTYDSYKQAIYVPLYLYNVSHSINMCHKASGLLRQRTGSFSNQHVKPRFHGVRFDGFSCCGFVIRICYCSCRCSPTLSEAPFVPFPIIIRQAQDLFSTQLASSSCHSRVL